MQINIKLSLICVADKTSWLTTAIDVYGRSLKQKNPCVEVAEKTVLYECRAKYDTLVERQLSLNRWQRALSFYVRQIRLRLAHHVGTNSTTVDERKRINRAEKFRVLHAAIANNEQTCRTKKCRN